MGFQDALFLLDIPYDSPAALEFADRMMELVSYHAILTSSKLAVERGAYETFKGSKWDRGLFPIDTIDLLERERGMPIEVSRERRLDWAPVYAHVKAHGMRNSNTMAIAPTATIANIAGCFPCIEPIYKNIYVKANISGEFTVVNDYLVRDLKALGLWNAEMLDQLKYFDGNVQMIAAIPDHLKAKYREAFEIDPIVALQSTAARGKWVDQSQSHNVFMKGTSGKKLTEIYLTAWRLGLKTTYYLRTLAASQIEKSTLDAVEVRLHAEARLHRGRRRAGRGRSRGGSDAAGGGRRRRGAGREVVPDRRSGLRSLSVSQSERSRRTMPIINNSKTDPNKILPIRYPWAREYYKSSVANNWTPEEVSMQKDVEQWKSTRVLSEGERRLILWNLGFFSTAESLTANNIVLAVYQHVTNPESRQYMLRQAFEEAIHTDTFIYCCDTLGLDPDEIYNMYLRIPSIKEKDAFVVDLTQDGVRPGIHHRGERQHPALRPRSRRLLRDHGGHLLLRRVRDDARAQASEQDGRHRRAVRIHHARRKPAPGVRLRPDQHHPHRESGDLDAGVPRSDHQPGAPGGDARTALRLRRVSGRGVGDQRGAVRELRGVRRRSPPRSPRPAEAVQPRQSVPLDVAGDRPGEGKELLRDARHRISAGLRARVGLTEGWQAGRSTATPACQLHLQNPAVSSSHLMSWRRS